jgi:hypothetical protein
VPLTAYFDGANSEGHAMTLTCLAATQSLWPEIKTKWLEAKQQHGDPAYLHMTDLMALEGIYKGWSTDQRDGLIRALVEALSSFMDHPHLQSFTCRVNLEVYGRWKARRELPTPERICARIVFPHLVEWFYRPEQGTSVDVMDVFFDQNEPFIRHIRADWNSGKIRHEYPIWNLIRSIEEAEMKSTPSLQMADMICWGFHRQGTYTHPQPWLVDFDEYTTAVGASNAVRGTFIEVGEQTLANDPLLEEGQALIELWNKKRPLVANPTKEYTDFDRMIRRLLHNSCNRKR